MKQKLWKRVGTAALAAGLVISLAGCKAEMPNESNQSGTGKTVNLTASVSPAEPAGISALTEEQATLLTDFGLRLAWHSMSNGENALISPMSVATALGMTANGAEGRTLQEMESVLGMEQEDLNRALYTYWRDLPRSEAEMLQSANSVWLTDHERFTVEQAFLQTCADYYGADIFQAPMNQKTCREINRWVKEQTDGMIPEVLDQIPPEAILYLVNALAFDGKWLEPYKKDQVQDGVFLTHTGMPVRTKLLYSEESYYLENELVTGVMKPYQGGNYAFVGLLPKGDRSLMALLDELDGESLHALLKHPETVPVHTLLPKFETEYQLDLREALESMGMQLAFEEQQADFSKLGTSEDGNIYISRVLHRTFLSLTEQGTRAGAATVVEAKDGCAVEPTYREVYLDQPFIYLLIDTKTCLPLLIGCIKDPTGTAPEPFAGGPPMTVQVNGTLYQNTGRREELGPRCGTMDGKITSSVALDELPNQDNQSNFGTGWGYQGSGPTITMNFGRHWIVFEQVP